MFEELARLQFETQCKMREEFINDFMKHIHFQVDSPEFEEAMAETIRKIIETAYNKGAHDTMDLIMEVDLALMMEGGEDDD